MVARDALLALVAFGMAFASGGVGAVRTMVTNEDIRDAILQVVHVVRSIDDKLERHEHRERALGEQLKKGMISIDKRIKMMDPARGPLSRLDQRLAAVETILLQKDEYERAQHQKTFDTVEDIQKNLPMVVEQLKRDILQKVGEVQAPAAAATPAALDDFQRQLQEKIGEVLRAVNGVQEHLGRIRGQNDEAKDISIKSARNLDAVTQQLNSSGELLEKFENKLAEYNNRIVEPRNDQQPNDWQTNVVKALEVQKNHIEQILSDVQSMNDKFSKLPNKTDVDAHQNTTLKSLEQLRLETSQQPLQSAKLFDEKTKGIQDDMKVKHEETVKAINEITDLTGALAEGFAKNYEQIKDEIHNMNKVEQVMVQTADNVLDTKRRVEYGVHQILAEVTQLMKSTSKEFNTAINERFDNFETSILDDETGALANLTSKIGKDIDQVWRQIGIMHQQMSATGDTLHKLQNQTDAYVNGSLSAMDNMKGKVGKITGRITEVDENLNFLLGKLSLVTQEFNQIKTGLGQALDEIRGTFKSVKNNIESDPGPGPHKINSNEVTETK